MGFICLHFCNCIHCCPPIPCRHGGSPDPYWSACRCGPELQCQVQQEFFFLTSLNCNHNLPSNPCCHYPASFNRIQLWVKLSQRNSVAYSCKQCTNIYRSAVPMHRCTNVPKFWSGFFFIFLVSTPRPWSTCQSPYGTPLLSTICCSYPFRSHSGCMTGCFPPGLMLMWEATNVSSGKALCSLLWSKIHTRLYCSL